MDEDSVIILARSMKGITDKVPVYVYQEARKQVVCVICSQDFRYKGEETDFSGKLMDYKFSDLKKILRRHLKTMGHIQMVQERMEISKVDEKEEARYRVIGRTIGGLVYHLLYHGRPDEDLPRLIYRVRMAGGDVGDINHSHNLVAKLLPEISGVVAGRLKGFLSSRMVATGSLPPCNIMADKNRQEGQQAPRWHPHPQPRGPHPLQGLFPWCPEVCQGVGGGPDR